MMMLFDYTEDDGEDGSWNWYYCTMMEPETLAMEEESWPVFADSFDAAMNIYMLMVKLKYNVK